MPFPETAKFPASVADILDLLSHKNKIPSQSSPTLATGINDTVDSFSVASGGGAKLPTDNFVMSIDDEIMFVASRSTDALSNVVRGFEGTTPASHSAGATISARVTAKAHNQLAAEVNAIETYLKGQSTTSSQTALISGGGVVWVSGLTFNVSLAVYLISGVQYTSLTTSKILDAADATFDRIDLIVVDDNSTVIIVKGTASANPVAPTVDPSTQLTLTFVYIPANSSTPANLSTTNIYLENTEWTGASSGTGWNLASTNNPYQGTKDIEATTVAKGSYIQYVNPSGVFLLTSFNYLVFYIRSKATWPSSRSLSIVFYNGTVLVGAAVTLNEGAFGFSSSNVSTYQQIAIPVSLFSAMFNVDRIRITVAGGGGSATLGFYLDSILLQGGVAQAIIPANIMKWRGDWGTTTSYNIYDVVEYSGEAYVALQSSLNQNPTISGSLYWSRVGSLSPRVVVGFPIGNGVAGSNVGAMLTAPYGGSVSKCTVIVKRSDPSVALRFVINQNGISVFTTTQQIPAGVSSGYTATITALTSVPLSVSLGDKFTIDIAQGSELWQFTAQLE